MSEGKKYITPQGAQKLRDEFEDLWNVQRPKVVLAVGEAAAQGDRSENAEYIYGKKKLREIDRRVRWIKKRLESLTIVEQKPENQKKVFFGAYVKIQIEGKPETVYQIVGSDDLDLKKNLITLASPLGKALKGQEKGAEVIAQLPSGQKKITILDVSYDGFE